LLDFTLFTNQKIGLDVQPKYYVKLEPLTLTKFTFPFPPPDIQWWASDWQIFKKSQDSEGCSKCKGL